MAGWENKISEISILCPASRASFRFEYERYELPVNLRRVEKSDESFHQYWPDPRRETGEDVVGQSGTNL